MKPSDRVADKYVLGSRLGIGGMGEVWSARHTTTGRDVAIKVMHPHVAVSDTSRQRFLREARVSSVVRHPSIVDMMDAGALEDGQLYLVMELLEGFDLSDAFCAAPPLTVRDLCVIARDVAGALAAAHEAGIVHRDIKPANIFLHVDRATGLTVPKVLDFGVSKFSTADDSLVTQASSVVGSPRYMSPEQTRSSALADHRTDLWALGVVLFEGLTGTWPHEGDGLSSLVLAIATTEPRSIDAFAPHLPESLRSIVRSLLQPVETRCQSAHDLEAHLDVALVDPSLSSLPLPAPLTPRERSRSVSSSGLRFRMTASSSDALARASVSLPAAISVATSGDRLTGSISDMNVETLALAKQAGPMAAQSFPDAPVIAIDELARKPARSAAGLWIALTLLGLTALGIAAAVVVTVREQPEVASAAPSAAPSTAEAAAAPSSAPIDPEAPEPEAIASALPSASAPAPTPSATATPKPTSQPAPRPAAARPKSKIEELGSGL